MIASLARLVYNFLVGLGAVYIIATIALCIRPIIKEKKKS